MLKTIKKKDILILLVTLLVSFNLHAQTLLFKITGNNIKKPSYLFGTIHLTSNNKNKMYAVAVKKLKKCKSYAMEINPSDFNNEGVINKLLIPNGKTTREFVSKELYDSLSLMFYKATGMSYEGFEKIQPIFLVALMNIGQKGNKAHSQDVLTMDIALAKVAEKKMKVNGLESISEQLEALAEISIVEQIEQLLQNEKGNLEDSIYMTGDMNKIYQATTAEMTTSQIKALLIDRNIRMAERATLLLQKEPTFIAVGAAHLGGEKGLVSLLRQKGFEIEEISK